MDEKQLCLYQATNAARKAVELLEMRATGAAKHELLNALALLEKAFQSKS